MLRLNAIRKTTAFRSPRVRVTGALTRSLLALSVCLTTLAVKSLANDQSVIRDGDRIAMVGDGLIEQAQYSGWIESIITAAVPEKAITFRNIGWSADTPAGDSRTGLSLVQAGREPQGEGWRQLEKQLELTRPTLLIVGYGMASALEGSQVGQISEATEQFRRDLQRLVDATRRITPDARCVFVGPIEHLSASPSQQASLLAHRSALELIATATSSPFVDLSTVANAPEHRQSAIRLTSDGYREVAVHIARELRLVENASTSVDAIAQDDRLDKLRDVILRKNQWWFHRSRPANMAYVFGFRKHEQGQNAGEIPQFDELIVAEEARIRRLADLENQADVELPPARLESAFAKFDEQPLPEFTVHPEWEISLWAQNPLLNKPIHMNFDAQGRLWVASSEAYPMIEVGQAAPDRIVVLEDTNGDGTADQSNVFAEGLLIPTGVLPGDGGVYVAQSTDLLHLRDTDGDMKADEKVRVLSGFGTEDTHHNLHTLLWGPDGRLYMNQSVYTRSDLETPAGIVRLKAGGGMRVNTQQGQSSSPDYLKTNVFFRGLWNSWGHRFDRFGQSFLTDGAGFAGIAYSFPGATFNPTPRARHQLDLISPGSWPKFASLEIIDGSNYPADWQGSLITCDFRANRVTRFSLTQDAAGFVTRQEADLVRTSAATFRPIDVKLGPDGAIYIADWSNPIINHGEVDFRDARRDRWHGRIWRLKWTSRENNRKKQDLAALDNSELLTLLIDGDGYQRSTARKLLSDRGSSTSSSASQLSAEQLSNWIDSAASDEQRQAMHAMEVMWLSQAMGQADRRAIDLCLAANDGRIRAAAVRALGTAYIDRQLPAMSDDEWQEVVAEKLSDDHPRVRLEAVRALARQRSVAGASRALNVLSMPMDRFIEHALTLSINEVAEDLTREIESGHWLADQHRHAADSQAPPTLVSQKLEFVVTKIEPSLAAGLLANFLRANELADNTDGPWIELIGKAGGKAELLTLLKTTTSGQLSESATLRALSSLSVAHRLRKLIPSDPGQITLLVRPGVQPDSVVQSAIGLVARWGLKGQSAKLIQIAAKDDMPTQVRTAAISALRDLTADGATDLMAKLSSDTNQLVQDAAIGALAQIAPDKAVEPFIAQLKRSTDAASAQAVWRKYIDAPKFAEKIQVALADAGLDTFMVDAGRQVLSTKGEQLASLKAVLDSMGTKATKLAYTPELVAEITDALSSADPHRGEAVYRRNELACVSCHAIGGVGGKVGPDMTSLGASAPVDYIIESLVDPAAKIKEGYHSVSVATEDGQVYTGIQVSSNDDTLVLRDANGKMIEIPQVDIVGKKAAASLMPSGVVDRLTKQERFDLVAFLSKLGKPGQFDASRGGVAREFEVFAGTHRIEQQGAERITQGQITRGWKPAVSLVSGDLPRETMVELTKQPRNISLVHVYARTVVQADRDGEVTVRVSSPTAALWIDGAEVEGKGADGGSAFAAKLSPGKHLVLVRLDARDLPDSLRIEAENVAFAAPNSILDEGANNQ